LNDGSTTSDEQFRELLTHSHHSDHVRLKDHADPVDFQLDCRRGVVCTSIIHKKRKAAWSQLVDLIAQSIDALSIANVEGESFDI
jgi:hypothetical protein